MQRPTFSDKTFSEERRRRANPSAGLHQPLHSGKSFPIGWFEPVLYLIGSSFKLSG
jgi:hypothetical protein